MAFISSKIQKKMQPNIVKYYYILKYIFSILIYIYTILIRCHLFLWFRAESSALLLNSLI